MPFEENFTRKLCLVSLSWSWLVRTDHRVTRPELPFAFDLAHATWPISYNHTTMFADRMASFKQPPRHVIDTTLSQAVRRNKVCRCAITHITVLRSPDRPHQALEEQKRVRHILVASGSAIQSIIYRDGLGAWKANAILIYLPT